MMTIKRKIFTFATAAFMSTALIACDSVQSGETKDEKMAKSTPLTASDLTTLEDKIAYIQGYNIGEQLTKTDENVNLDIVASAMRAAKDGQPSQFTPEETRSIMTEYQTILQAKDQARNDALSQKNITDGAAYIASYAGGDGIVKTESGLRYKVLNEGTGKTPSATDTVKVHYKGTLIDGTEFDSSYTRGEPATFPVNGVIKGWTEMLQLMKEGGKVEVVIPSELAYGANGPASIGPNSVLIFEVELLEVLN